MLPKGFESGGPRVVGRVHRALHGAKKAGNLWAAHMAATLIAACAVRSTTDPCLFICRHPEHGTIHFLVYVSDTAMAAQSAAAMASAKAILINSCKVRDLGEMKDFLGMRIFHDRIAGTLTAAIPGRTAALLTSLRMSGAHVTKVPMAPGTALPKGTRPILPAITATLSWSVACPTSLPTFGRTSPMPRVS